MHSVNDYAPIAQSKMPPGVRKNDIEPQRIEVRESNLTPLNYSMNFEENSIASVGGMKMKF